MAASANAFNIMPVDFSIEFFKSLVVWSRGKERGYNFFINGFVHAVKLFSSTDKIIDITAKFYRYIRKNEDPHKINMTINCNLCVIDDSYCSCQAGLVSLVVWANSLLSIIKSTYTVDELNLCSTFASTRKIILWTSGNKTWTNDFFSQRKISLCTSGNKFMATFIRFITCNS